LFAVLKVKLNKRLLISYVKEFNSISPSDHREAWTPAGMSKGTLAPSLEGEKKSFAGAEQWKM
jgi:hypothetical protein